MTAQQIFAATSAARRPCPFIPAAIRAVSSFCCSAAPMILVAATRVPNSSYQVVRGGCDGLRGQIARENVLEGRTVVALGGLPGLKVDADSKNIEELTVVPDPERYRAMGLEYPNE